MTCERVCANCANWSNTEPSMSTGIRRPRGANEEIGTCLLSGPTVVSLAGIIVSVFPETHADRHCGDWTEEDDGGPDDGETVVPFPTTARLAA